MASDLMATIRKLARDAAADPSVSPSLLSICELIGQATRMGEPPSRRGKPQMPPGGLSDAERVAVARIVLSHGATRRQDDSLVIAGSRLRNAVIDIIQDAAQEYRDAPVRDRIALVKRVQDEIEESTGIRPDVDLSKHAVESWAMGRRTHPRDRKWTVIAELWAGMVSHPIEPEAVRKAYVRRTKS